MTGLPGPVTWLAFLIAAAAARAQGNVTHVRTQLGIEELRLELVTADVDGDGLKDLLVPRYDRALQDRELLIYLLRDNGAFAQEPDLRHELKSGIVAWGVGEFRPDEPGVELLFLARDAAYTFSPRSIGYAGNIRKIAEAPMLFDMAALRSFPVWPAIADLEGDGVDEVALATSEGFLLVAADGRELGRVPRRVLHGQRPAGERRFKLLDFELQAQTLTELLVPDEDHAAWDPPPVLYAEDSLPLPFLEDSDGDGLRDLVYYDGGSLFVHRQGAAGDGGAVFHAEPTLELDLGDEDGADFDLESLRLVRAGGGEAIDLLLARSEGSDPLSEEWQIILYHDPFSKARRLGQPDGIAVLDSSRAEPVLGDFDRDGRVDLAISSWTTELQRLGLGGVRIAHRILLHPGLAEGGYRRRAQVLSEREFDADEFETFARIPPLQADLDGDGRVDLLETDAKGTVEVRPLRGRGGSAEFERPSMRIPLDAAEASLRVEDLNGDGVGDLIVTHRLTSVIETWVSLKR